MKKYIETLRTYVEQNPPNCGDAESVLGMLYECHNENSPSCIQQLILLRSPQRRWLKRGQKQWFTQAMMLRTNAL